MTKYLSKDILLAAYRQLRKLTSAPDKQGQTQKTSVLRYVTALDAFAFSKHRDCDTTDANDKKCFTDLVGKVVAIDDGLYTSNFYKSLNTDDDYKVGSNFYSANVVPNSSLKPAEKFKFPRRKGNEPVFEIQNCVLLTDSIKYENLTSYLTTPSLRCAYVVWLMRKSPFTDAADQLSFNSELRQAFATQYSDKLQAALWQRDTFKIDHLTANDIEVFADQPCRLTKSDLETTWSSPMSVSPNAPISEPRNLIYFGAPGTGKSYQLARKAEECFASLERNVSRVTFHPDYTYAQFIGCFKPYSGINADGKHEIGYRYCAGPFIELYVDAVTHPDENFLLIIEELNRANPAAVFGDIFQLLDRNQDGSSEYPIRVSEDLGRYLYEVPDFPCTAEEREAERVFSISIPSNMYIWATINSADQGVFPMDTAFKRRWDFRYIDIDSGEDVIADKTVLIGNPPISVKWNDLRKGINAILLKSKVNEDKLLGPFFIAPSVLNDQESFDNAFRSKVLLYLFEDAAKTKKDRVFKKGSNVTYASICHDFDVSGVSAFADEAAFDFQNDEVED